MKNLFILLLTVVSVTINAQTLQDKWMKSDSSGVLVLDPYYSDGVTLVWSGDSLEGKANGYGELKKYKNGILESTYIGDYKLGIREGKGVFYHSDGSVLKCSFIDGQAMGLGVKTEVEGAIYEGNIVNYRAHGKGSYTYANGIKFEGIFISDKEYTGVYIFPDGTKKYLEEYKIVKKLKRQKKSEYVPELGVPVVEFFDKDWSRCKKSKASYYRMVTYKAQNIPDGVVKDYYISGRLQSVFYPVYIDYNDDNLTFNENVAIWYYESGNIENKRQYFNNEQNGADSSFYESGEVQDVYYYKNGMLDGKYYSFYKNGQISLEKTYVNNICEGTSKSWNEEGELKDIYYYKNGKLLDDKYIHNIYNNPVLIHAEDFVENKDDWETYNKEYFVQVIDEYKLFMGNLKKRETIVVKDMPINEDKLINIFTWFYSYRKYASIVFGYLNANNYNSFIVKNSQVRIVKVENGKKIILKDWTAVTDIDKNNVNSIEIRKKDNLYYFNINSTSVLISNNIKLYGNKMGYLILKKDRGFVYPIRTIEAIEGNEEIIKRDPNNELKLSSNWTSGGTGFFISNKGYIATNYHVVKNAKNISVEYTVDNKKVNYTASIEVYDSRNDLAILKIDSVFSIKMNTLPYGFSIKTKDVGAMVFTLGYPLTNIMGDEIKYTDGKIGSRTGFKGDITTYQISTPIQPGNSGGPLFDINGNIIGVTSSSLNREVFNSENVNYAVKISYLKNLIDLLPDNIPLEENTTIQNKSLTEKIKIISDYIPIIRVK